MTGVSNHVHSVVASAAKHEHAESHGAAGRAHAEKVIANAAAARAAEAKRVEEENKEFYRQMSRAMKHKGGRRTHKAKGRKTRRKTVSRK